MLRTALAPCLLVLALSCASAQTGGGLTEFEVASIKPAPPQGGGRFMVMMRGGPGTPDPGQLTYANVSLRNILMNAYGVKTYQISGPGWLDTERFDLTAKIPKGATKEDLKVMLQSFLADRFKLTLHREQKELPIYALVVAKGGPKLKESAEEETPPSPDAPPLPPPGRMPVGKDGFPANAQGWTGTDADDEQRPSPPLGEPAADLGHDRPAEQPVGTTRGRHDGVDRQVRLHARLRSRGRHDEGADGRMPPPPPPPPGGAGPAPGDNAPDNSSGATLFTALQEQLGLKLEPKKGPVEMLVIDHLEKTPTEN